MTEDAYMGDTGLSAKDTAHCKMLAALAARRNLGSTAEEILADYGLTHQQLDDFAAAHPELTENKRQDISKGFVLAPDSDWLKPFHEELKAIAAQRNAPEIG